MPVAPSNYNYSDITNIIPTCIRCFPSAAVNTTRCVVKPLLLLLLLGGRAVDRVRRTQPGEPPTQSVLSLNVRRRCDVSELLHHGVPPEGPLYCVGGRVGSEESSVPVGQDLHLFVKQVLAKLVRFRHLGATETLAARVPPSGRVGHSKGGGHHPHVSVLPHVTTPVTTRPGAMAVPAGPVA